MTSFPPTFSNLNFFIYLARNRLTDGLTIIILGFDSSVFINSILFFNLDNPMDNPLSSLQTYCSGFIKYIYIALVDKYLIPLAVIDVAQNPFSAQSVKQPRACSYADIQL